MKLSNNNDKLSRIKAKVSRNAKISQINVKLLRNNAKLSNNNEKLSRINAKISRNNESLSRITPNFRVINA